MIFNIINSGIISTITVTTAAGATVTCVMSPYSYSATANSSGKATFTVHSKGTWTVTSTKGGGSNSDTVSITGSGQSKSVSLPIRYWLFKAGEGVKHAISWGTSPTYAITDTSYFILDSSNIYVGDGGTTYGQVVSKSYAYTNSKVDLTNYTKFVIDIDGNGSTTGLARMLAGTSRAGIGTNTINSFTCPSRTTVTYNISSLTGSNYVGMYNGTSVGAKVYNWYLEM